MCHTHLLSCNIVEVNLLHRQQVASTHVEAHIHFTCGPLSDAAAKSIPKFLAIIGSDRAATCAFLRREVSNGSAIFVGSRMAEGNRADQLTEIPRTGEAIPRAFTGELGAPSSAVIRELCRTGRPRPDGAPPGPFHPSKINQQSKIVLNPSLRNGRRFVSENRTWWWWRRRCHIVMLKQEWTRSNTLF